MTHNGGMFVCVGIFWWMSEYKKKKNTKLSKQVRKKVHEMIYSCVTCGTKGDERLRVLADHRHFFFGEGQPAHDVFYKIIGDDGGHVPLQLPQHDQFPVLKAHRWKKKRRKKCQSGG